MRNEDESVLYLHRRSVPLVGHRLVEFRRTADDRVRRQVSITQDETDERSLAIRARKRIPGSRRKNNEDAVLACPELSLWAVADGMGGHAAGDVASQAITEALAAAKPRTSLAEMVDQVDDLLCDVNHRLRDHSVNHCTRPHRRQHRRDAAGGR